MKKKFEIKPVKKSIIKTSTLLKAISIPLAVGTLTSCNPFIAIGMPAVEKVQVQQTISIIDSQSKAAIPGLNVAVYQNGSLVSEGVTGDDGVLELNYIVYSQDDIELKVTDIDGTQNNQYLEYNNIIQHSISQYTIEMIQTTP